MYNLNNDPDEDRNLIAAPQYTRTVAELQAELARLMHEAGLTPETDKMPVDAGIKKELPDQKIR